MAAFDVVPPNVNVESTGASRKATLSFPLVVLVTTSKLELAPDSSREVKLWRWILASNGL